MFRSGKSRKALASAVAGIEMLEQRALRSGTMDLVVSWDDRNNATGGDDSQRSAVFYDPSTMQPLFAVSFGSENNGVYNAEDVEGISVDPQTGDVFVLGFDSGTPGNTVFSGTPFQEKEGDLDLYRLDTSKVYAYWRLNGGGAYTTYGVALGGPGDGQADFDVNQTNPFYLPGVINKVADNITRNQNPAFHDFDMTLRDSSNFVYIDSWTGTTSGSDATTAEDLVVVRESSPGSGVWSQFRTSLDVLEAGSLADPGPGADAGTEAIALAYATYTDGTNTVEGVWVTEDDGEGDDVAFFGIDFATGAFIDGDTSTAGIQPLYTLAWDEVPTGTGTTGANGDDGDAGNNTFGWVSVNPANGDLWLPESDFFDPGSAGASGNTSLVSGNQLDDSTEPDVYKVSGITLIYVSGVPTLSIGGQSFQGEIDAAYSGVFTDDDTAITNNAAGVAFDFAGSRAWFIDDDSNSNIDAYQLNLSTGAVVAPASYLNFDSQFVEPHQTAYIGAPDLADFDGDGDFDAADVNAAVTAFSSTPVALASFFNDVLGTNQADVNLDWLVNQDDIDIATASFGTSGLFSDGDIDGDGDIDQDDLDFITAEDGFNLGKVGLAGVLGA